MANRPFLFLDSPRVGDIGHSYVVAPGEPLPPEEMLGFVATHARARIADGRALAARHEVNQIEPPAVRYGDELLICGGAEPANPEDVKAVQAMLRELLRALPAGQLKTDGQLKRDGLLYTSVHEAQFMKDLADKFRKDARVENIQWKIVREPTGTEFSATEVSNRPPDTAHPTLRARFQRLPLLMRLAVIAAILFVMIGSSVIVAKVVREKGNAGPVSEEPSVPKAAVALEKWAFLTKDDWPRLMKATGEPGLADELPKLMSALEANRKSAQERPSFGVPKLPAKEPVSTEDLARALKRISSWSKRVVEEFELPGEDAIQTVPVLQALMRAEGATGIEAAAWFRNTKNQRVKYPAELQRKAELLEKFGAAFRETPPGELPSRLRSLLGAIDVFSKSPATAGDALLPFRDLSNKELSKVTPSPPGYEVLTVRDAHRVEVLQRVLGSGEFGLVAFGVPVKADKREWTEIRETIEKGAALAEKGLIDGASAELLRQLHQAFSSPGQRPKPM